MRFRLFAVVFSIPLLAALLAGAPQDSARAAAFTDSAGRRVALPDHIGRVLPAERNAEVLLYVLAPDKLAGFAGYPARRAALSRPIAVRTLRWRPRGDPASMAETARRVGAELIIDAGPVSAASVAFADHVQQLSGVPYILVDDSFARVPRMMRSVGGVLGVADRADDLSTFAEHAIDELRGRLLIQPATKRLRIYYGMGPDGLTTPLPGSPAAAALEQAGVLNVAATLGQGTQVRIAPGELLAWNPDIVIAEHPGFYAALHREQRWRRLAAVRNKRVYLEPSYPFGWIEHPAGINRVIGLYWLAAVLYPESTEPGEAELRSAAWRNIACTFYDKFYRIKLTNGQLERMIGSAGAAPKTQHRAADVPAISPLPPGITPGFGLTPTVLSGATEACTTSTVGSPKPLPGLTTVPGAGPDAASPLPGLPRPGQRGRAAPGMPGAPPLR